MEKNQKCGGKKQKNLIVGRAGEVRSRMYPYKREKPAPVGSGFRVWGGGDLLSRGPPQYHRRGGA